MLKLMTGLVALLGGALLLIVVFWIWRRDEMVRCGKFIDLHYDRWGRCDYIKFGGVRYYPDDANRVITDEL